MKSRLAILLSIMTLTAAVLWTSTVLAATCADILKNGRRFDAVVTASSGRLLSRGPFAVTEIRTGNEGELVFSAAYTPESAAPMQLSGLVRDGKVSMIVDDSVLPEDTGHPAWLGGCSETGITGRIGGDERFELLPITTTDSEPAEDNAKATQPARDKDYWPAAAEAPIIIPEPEDILPPESNASEQHGVDTLPELPRPDADNETGLATGEDEDPVARALRELAAESNATTSAEPSPHADGYAIRNETTPDAEGKDLADSGANATFDMAEADCRYLPRFVFQDEFPSMRLSPIHSTSADIPGEGRVCFLTLQAGEGSEADVDFAFYTGAGPLAIMRGPGIPVTVRGLSLRDLSGDNAPEVIAVMQRTDGGYENRVYWSEKKAKGFVWVDDPAVNRHVSGESSVDGVIAIITGEKISTVSAGNNDAVSSESQYSAPREQSLTPEPIQRERATPPSWVQAGDFRVGDVMDLTGRFARAPGGLLFNTHGSVLDTVYVVDAMPPDDEARLGELTRRDSRIAAEVMQLETREGKRVVRIQVLQVQ
ncbi:hypothetical protein DPQ33_10340 [Oceanidesulfovibrio indonesiensis]|uniref:Uncharacterized protein n=1 Tax=Oceanidesulfovibrio indonesiensis TaxID=54767 RepID=A0A7M3MED1_9BACT|nr:hypothetical protein [Oceanidesulfovibrio indonesiensis]TVM17180.1 hypothetical protein DPQ33_10340 [Oceanidesulfovibrio indonesiensis]